MSPAFLFEERKGGCARERVLIPAFDEGRPHGVLKDIADDAIDVVAVADEVVTWSGITQ